MDISSGKIYLANQRGLTETATVKRYSTFNFDQYHNEHKEAFGDLFICNDEYLAGGKMAFFLSKADSYQIFIPVTGEIDIVQGNKESTVKTGQIQVLNLGKGEVLEISNSNPVDTVNYIQLGLKTDLFLLKASEMLFNFELENKQNQLFDLISSPKLPFRLTAGLLAGHKEVIYQLKNKQNKFYTFIIDGTFEVEGQLLNTRDGLALWDLNHVELKALSDHASIITLEMFPLF